MASNSIIVHPLADFEYVAVMTPYSHHWLTYSIHKRLIQSMLDASEWIEVVTILDDKGRLRWFEKHHDADTKAVVAEIIRAYQSDVDSCVHCPLEADADNFGLAVFRIDPAVPVGDILKLLRDVLTPVSFVPGQFEYPTRMVEIDGVSRCLLLHYP